MAITQTACTSFKYDLITGALDLTLDTLYLALYDSTATLNATTDTYIIAGEVTGSGYTAGGNPVTGASVTTTGTVVYFDFNDVVWAASVFTARGALLYNSTQGGRAIAVFDFGADKTVSGGDFTVSLPANGPTTALIRLE